MARRGFFQPDFFTFGQTVYLSPLYAAAQAVAGVGSVEITTFQHQGLPETSGLTNGFLAMNRLEIARLDNDPNFAERGIFTFKLEVDANGDTAERLRLLRGDHRNRARAAAQPAGSFPGFVIVSGRTATSLPARLPLCPIRSSPPCAA